MLGMSIYLSEDLEEQFIYLKKIKKYGCQEIFTSLHIPEDDPVIYLEKLQQLGQMAKDLNMQLMVDISPDSLNALGLTWKTADNLLKWGVTGLRLDYGIKEATIISLSNRMSIALNASTLSIESLQSMKKNGLNTPAVEAWHNFYPRPETGIGLEDFLTKNEAFSKEGITTMAFIPGDEKLRGPLFKGLPTLEKHRHCSAFSAFVDMKNYHVDKIFTGDFSLSEMTWQRIRAFQDGIIHLYAEKDTDYSAFIKGITKIQTNRSDVARDCIRSTESRQYASYGQEKIHPENCIERPVGTITIDNENYLRYQGEIQITKVNLTKDAKVNVLGHVVPEDLSLLRWVRNNQKFKINWIN